jgi:hypothetical protein
MLEQGWELQYSVFVCTFASLCRDEYVFDDTALTYEFYFMKPDTNPFIIRGTGSDFDGSSYIDDVDMHSSGDDDVDDDEEDKEEEVGVDEDQKDDEDDMEHMNDDR